VRLFAAVQLPPDIVAHLDTVVTPHRDDALRWTTPDSWHLTLAFYGEVPDARVPGLKARLTRAAHRYSAIDLGLDGVGRFGDRALWVGVVGDLATLRALARSAAAAGRRAGAAAEETRRFRGHVTLARAPRPVDLRPFVAALAGYRGPTWTATDITLVRSRLGAGAGHRPKYELLSTHPFG
jgi:2'-5' RNA ligase